MHGPVALFLEVIALAIILLVVGLVVPHVLVVASTTIMASILLMTIIRLGVSCNHVGCFNGSRDICGDGAACSLIHGYAR